MNRSVIISALMFAGMLAIGAACSDKSAESAANEPIEVHVTALGMHCGSCEETVETTFMRMPGVDSVKADYTTGDVYVLVDTTQTAYSRLEELITELGFDMLNDDPGM